MTVQQLKEALSLKLLAGEEGLSQEVSGCYIGDLLSWVMGRAKAGDAWLTVMGNISALAVASLICGNSLQKVQHLYDILPDTPKREVILLKGQNVDFGAPIALMA